MEQTAQSLRDLRKGVFNEGSKDLLLAALIAIIGLTGSYLVLGKSFQGGADQTAVPEISGLDHSSIQSQNAISGSEQKNAFRYQEENLAIQGSMVAGSILRISNQAFDSNKSYLIDFGNGIRHKMTTAVMSMRYQVAGLYLIQCYVEEEGQWRLLSAETISIRKAERHEINIP